MKDAGEIIDQHPMYDYANHLKDLSRAFERGDTNTIRAERLAVEKGFTRSDVEYEIVRLYVKPIEYWKNGTYLNLDRVAVFTSDQEI